MSNIEFSSTYILNSVHISGSGIPDLSGTVSDEPLYFFGTKDKIDFIKDAEYTLKFNLLCLKSSSLGDAKLEIYLVGNAFPSRDSLGYKIAEYTSDAGLNRSEFLEQEVNFFSLENGTAHIRFVVYGGNWYVANLGLFTARERGYNPDFAKFLILVPPLRRFETLQFKVELFDNTHTLVPLDIQSDEIFFAGGTTIIRGTDNRIYGSIFVTPSGSGPVLGTDSSGSYIGIADTETAPLPRPIPTASLPTYTGPALVTMYSGSAPFSNSLDGPAVGFQIVGYDPTDGSTSFLDFNTFSGRLIIQGDVSFISGSAASSSDALAFQQIQNIINGIPFTDSASFIFGKEIYSASIISGANAFFTGSVTASNFVGSGSGIVGVISSSYSLTASFAANAGGTVGPGSINQIPKFDTATTITDSNISDDGTKVIISSSTDVTGSLTLTGSLVLPDGKTTIRTVPYTWPSGDGGLDTVLTTDGAGGLTWTAKQSGSVESATSASVAVSASYAISASVAEFASTASFVINAATASYSPSFAIGESLYSQSSYTASPGTSSITIVSKTVYNAYFIDYLLTSGSSGQRVGTFRSTWSGSQQVYTETSTVDIGDTTQIALSASLDADSARLDTNIVSGTWTIKSLIRAI